MVDIDTAVRFEEPVSFRSLATLNHYLTVPQAFSYLTPYESTTHVLMTELVRALVAKKMVQLRHLRSGKRQQEFATLIVETVGDSYAEIDADFIEQVFDQDQAGRAPFSTATKTVYEIVVGEMCIGYTCLTKKHYSALKSGPTVLRPQFRGVGLGRAVREVIEAKAMAEGARKLYCTCPADRQDVLRYLVEGGLEIEARLRRHLAVGRDEYVLGKILREGEEGRIELRQARRRVARVVRIEAGDERVNGAVEYFLAWLKAWYFAPHASMREDIMEGMKLAEANAPAARKPKEMLVALSPRGQFRAVVLCTRKRSDMVKMNVVSDADDGHAIRAIVDRVHAELGAPRRVYCTAPTHMMSTCRHLRDAGMRVEGFLAAPFQSDVDHYCFGMNWASGNHGTGSAKATR